jgi:Tfp pilus assembly protein PilZ
MRLLTVAFGSAAEFLACYSARLVPGVLFCPTRARFASGEELMLEVGFPGMSGRTMVRGRGFTASSGCGGWVQLDGEDARAGDFLVAQARGQASSDAAERTHQRIPAALPVDCVIDEDDEPSPDHLIGQTQDIGSGGVFIRSASPPSVGTRLQVVLGPTSGGDRLLLEGRVAWIRRRDDDDGGFGVRFDRRARDGQRLRAMLRRARETGRVHFGR